MKNIRCKTLLQSAIMVSTICFSTITKAADWDFRWVVKNDTSKEIRGEVGTSQYPWDTTQIANAAFASALIGSEGKSIQVRDFPSLAAYAETGDMPLSHYTTPGSDDYKNSWAAHIFYDGKEYYGIRTCCNVHIDDIDAMNETPGGGHVTIQITENPNTHALAQINIIKPATGQCSMDLVQVNREPKT